MLSAPFLTPAETKMLVLLSASVERFSVSCMRDFLGTGYIETRQCSPVDNKPSTDNSSDAIICRGSDFARIWVLWGIHFPKCW